MYSTSDLRLAVLSDAHGNAFAMEAVAREIREATPDLIVNLGDQAWGQADPVRAMEIQRGLEAIEVRGNNDERLAAPSPQLSAGKQRLWSWLNEQLSARERARLATLPLTTALADGAVLAAHGTPESAWDGLLLHFDHATKVLRRRREDEILERLGDGQHQVYLVGHLHREETRWLGGRLLVNVGGVSWPNDGDPRARWALLTRRGERWEVQHRRTVYDWDAAGTYIRKYGPWPTEAAWHTEPVNDPLQ